MDVLQTLLVIRSDVKGRSQVPWELKGKFEKPFTCFVILIMLRAKALFMTHNMLTGLL